MLWKGEWFGDVNTVSCEYYGRFIFGDGNNCGGDIMSSRGTVRVMVLFWRNGANHRNWVIYLY